MLIKAGAVRRMMSDQNSEEYKNQQEIDQYLDCGADSERRKETAFTSGMQFSSKFISFYVSRRIC